MKKALVFLLIFASILLMLKPYAFSGIEEEMKKLEDYKKQLEQVKKSIREISDSSSQLQALVKNLNSEMISVNNSIDETKKQIDALQIEISKKEQAIKIKEEEISQREQDLESSINLSYKLSNYTAMELLFEGEDPQVISKRIAYISYISSYTKTLMDQAINDKNILNEQKTNLSKDKASLENFLTQKQKEEEILKEELDMKQSVIKALQEKKSYYLYKQDEIEKIIEEENKLIAQLIEEARKAELKLQTGLIWPLKGTITSYFGERIHPIFGTKDFHEGIDIAAPSGTPIKAAASGKVSYAGWMTGYGNVIIIYHGSDVSTLYAHQKSFAVKSGDYVVQGKVIGYVGSTGWSTGPHLHFGVYIGDKAVNPLAYLPP